MLKPSASTAQPGQLLRKRRLLMLVLEQLVAPLILECSTLEECNALLGAFVVRRGRALDADIPTISLLMGRCERTIYRLQSADVDTLIERPNHVTWHLHGLLEHTHTDRWGLRRVLLHLQKQGFRCTSEQVESVLNLLTRLGSLERHELVRGETRQASYRVPIPAALGPRPEWLAWWVIEEFRQLRAVAMGQVAAPESPGTRVERSGAREPLAEVAP